jgi:hypothetical protein
MQNARKARRENLMLVHIVSLAVIVYMKHTENCYISPKLLTVQYKILTSVMSIIVISRIFRSFNEKRMILLLSSSLSSSSSSSSYVRLLFRVISLLSVVLSTIRFITVHFGISSAD